MRFSIVLSVLSVAASASASAVYSRQLPECTMTCLGSPTLDLGGCEGSDNACLCRNEAFVKSSTACIVATCKGDDLATAIAASQALCRAVGVTLTGDTPTATDTTSPSSETGAPASTDTTAAPAESTPAPSTNAASSHGINAILGMVAIGLAAIAL